jgi:hypothetical protein
VASRGGSGRVLVSAPAGCSWTATSSEPYARLRHSGVGTGTGEIEYEVDANPTSYVTDFRKVAIQVRWPAATAGQNVWLSQFGNCSAAGTTVSKSFPAEGGRIDTQILVESPFNCPWRVEGGADWLTWVAPPPGQIRRGDGDLHVIVNPNTTGQARSTTFTVAEQVYVVNQAAR